MIKMYQKNDYSLKIIYKENGVPVDVSGWDYIFILKNPEDKSGNDSKAAFKKRGLITNAANGEFFINITSQEAIIPMGNFNCQIMLTRINPDNGLRQNKTLYNNKARVFENIVKEV